MVVVAVTTACVAKQQREKLNELISQQCKESPISLGQIRQIGSYAMEEWRNRLVFRAWVLNSQAA